MNTIISMRTSQLFTAILVVCLSASAALAGGPISFEPLREFFAGPHPFAIAGGDFDGNGTIDIVLSHQGFEKWTVLLGDGEGNFGPQVPIAGTRGGNRLAAVDIDNDGDLDVLGTLGLTGRLVIVENDGFGNFSLKDKLRINAALPVGLATGDFDNDGDVDAATFNFLGTVTVIVNDGLGEFRQVGVVLCMLTDPNLNVGNLVAGDLDSDGDLDLIGGSELEPDLVLLRNDPDNSDKAKQKGVTFRFRAAQLGFTPNVPEHCLNVDVGDLDGDGDLDVFDVNGNQANDKHLQVFLNNGMGKMTLGWEHSGLVIENVKLADMDLDGDLDAVLADHVAVGIYAGITVLVNDGSGNFSDGGSWATSDIETFAAPEDLLVDDLDGDGDLDVVVPNKGVTPGSIGVLINTTG